MSPARAPTHTAVGASVAFGLPSSVPATSNLVTTSNASLGIAYEGWVLKKRRKKMQGFARRYFTLYQTGLLSYSFEPGQATRDQINLHHAAISTAPGRKDIHIDSNTATFHIKCLGTDDFNNWMAAFRKFIAAGADTRRSASVRLTPRIGSVNLNRSGAVLEEMGLTLLELEDAIQALQQQDAAPKKARSIKGKPEKEKHKDHPMFGLFKRSSQQSPMHDMQLDNSQAESSHSSFSDQVQVPVTPLQHLQAIADTLRRQHMILSKSIQTLSFIDIGQTIQQSPLPRTAEEEEEVHSSSPSRFSTPRASGRASVATTRSDSVNEWYDAEDMDDGAQEFVLDVMTPEGTERPSRMTSNASTSSHSSADTDSETETEQEAPTLLASDNVQTDSDHKGQILRRTQLPAPPSGDEGSLFTILKKNVGKDLSLIALPVTFNEPLTMLQRAAEELEYYELLTQAAAEENPVDRLCYIAAFAVSSYAHTRFRSGRKGFNPMLAETFEDVRMKFIAEKVRHHPLVMAYHAEGPGWELYATSAGRTKFWGKSLEVIPLGTTHLKIGNDHFEWNKPSSFIRNLMVGTKYLEHSGKMTIENVTNNSRCVLDFKQNGYWGPANLVSGTVYSSSGEAVSQLEGKWDDQIAQTQDDSHFRILWRLTPFPKNAHEYYGFTSFGITLNEITPDLTGRLPPTDSRNRPDVRALEEGDLERAEETKTLVEDLQRERRRQNEERQPRWFKEVGEEWIYTGGYWEARARGWKDTPIEPLW